MECKKIEDMMQLYVEDLCCAESKQWIEEHVKECPACKEKLIRFRQEKEQEFQQDTKRKEEKAIDEKELEKELKPFKKLRRKLWVRCILDVIAIFSVVLFCIGIAVLAVNGWQKIENYELEKYGEKTISYLVDGEIDQFFSQLDLENVSVELLDGKEEYLQDCKADVTAFYENELKDEKVKVSVTVDRYYGEADSYSDKTVLAKLQTSKKEFWMQLGEGEGGFVFYNLYDMGNEDENSPQFEKLTLLSVASFDRKQVIPKMEELDEEYADKEEVPYIFALGLSENEQVKESWSKLRALMQDGVSIEESGCSGLYYDGDKDEMYTTLMWKLKDADGGVAYLEQEIRMPYLESRDSETLVISEGFSKEKVEQLKKVFQ